MAWYDEQLEKINNDAAVARIRARRAQYAAQAQPPEEKPDTSLLRKLLLGGAGQALATAGATVLETPVAISNLLENVGLHLPGLKGAEYGKVFVEPTQQAVAKAAGTEESRLDAIARMVGDIAGYAVPYVGLERAGVGLLGKAAQAAQKAGQLERAAQLESIAQKFVRPTTVGEWIGRETALGTGLYPLMELPRPEEERMGAAPYLAYAAAGGAAGHLLSKLLSMRRPRIAKEAPDEVQEALSSVRDQPVPEAIPETVPETPVESPAKVPDISQLDKNTKQLVGDYVKTYKAVGEQLQVEDDRVLLEHCDHILKGNLLRAGLSLTEADNMVTQVRSIVEANKGSLSTLVSPKAMPKATPQTAKASESMNQIVADLADKYNYAKTSLGKTDKEALDYGKTSVINALVESGTPYNNAVKIANKASNAFRLLEKSRAHSELVQGVREAVTHKASQQGKTLNTVREEIVNDLVSTRGMKRVDAEAIVDAEIAKFSASMPSTARAVPPDLEPKARAVLTHHVTKGTAESAKKAQELLPVYEDIAKGKAAPEAITKIEKEYAALPDDAKIRVEEPTPEPVPEAIPETAPEAVPDVTQQPEAQAGAQPPIEVGQQYTARMLEGHGAVLKAGREVTGTVEEIKDGKAIFKVFNKQGKEVRYGIPVGKVQWTRAEGAPVIPEVPKATATKVKPKVMEKTPKPAKVTQAITRAELSRDLKGASPRYGYRDKNFMLRFDSDVDKALYVVAQTKKSKRDDDFMRFLKGVFPGLSERELRGLGTSVRSHIKELAKTAEGDTIRIHDTGLWRQAGRIEVPKSETKKVVTQYDRALDDLEEAGITSGSSITAKELFEHSRAYVGDTLNAKKRLYDKAVSRGITITDAEELFGVGLSPEMVRRMIALQKKRRYNSIFAPASTVSDKHGSLSKVEMAMLPKKLQDEINAIDNDLVSVNKSIDKLFMDYGVHELDDLPEAAKTRLEALAEKRARISARRSKFSAAVKDYIRDAKVASDTSKRILSKIQTGEQLGGQAKYDANNDIIGYMIEGTKPGTKWLIPAEYTPSEYERTILRSTPSMWARYFAPMRDLFGESLVTPIRNARMAFDAELHRYSTAMEKILKPVLRDKKARERVYHVLEGKPLEGTTNQEIRVAKKLREKIYDPLFKIFDIEAERYLKNYAPRIRVAGSIEKAFPKGVPRELTFVHELERKGVDFPYETDVLTVTMKYIRGGLKKKCFDPALAKVLPAVAEKGTDPKRLDMYLNFVSNALGRPIEEEIVWNNTLRQFKEGLEDVLGRQIKLAGLQKDEHTLAAVTSVMNRLIYSSTLWLNPKAALTNLTQQVLSMALLDKNPLVGVRYRAEAEKLLRSDVGKQLLDYCWVLQDRLFLESFERIYGDPTKMTGKLVNRLGETARRTFSKAEKIGMYLFEEVDLYNVKSAFLMKLKYDLKHGASFRDAVDAANTLAANTQFLYGIDSPMIYKHPLGKLLGVLMSYPLNFANLMWKTATTNRKPTKDGILKVASVFGSLSALMYVLDHTGLNFSRETPLESIGGALPIAFVLRGYLATPITETISGLPEAVKDVADIGKAAWAHFDSESVSENPVLMKRAWESLINKFGIFIPAYTQGSRVNKFMKAALNNWNVISSEGAKQYRMGEIEGEPARVKDMLSLEKHLPAGGLLYQATGGKLPGEAIRTLLGPTTEQRERTRRHTELSKEISDYADLRRDAVLNYIKYKQTGKQAYKRAFLDLQKQIVEHGGNKITKKDVEHILEDQRKTALTRQREMLPKGYKLEQ